MDVTRETVPIVTLQKIRVLPTKFARFPARYARSRTPELDFRGTLVMRRTLAALSSSISSQMLLQQPS